MNRTELYQVGGWQAIAIAAIVLAVLGVLVSKVLERWLNRVLSSGDERRLSGSIFVNIMRFVVWGTTAAIICDQCFGIDAAGIVSALGVVGIAVSLGAQQTIANVIGGLIISLSSTFAPGDWVTIGGSAESEVIDTDWRSTTLRDENGIVYVVPNSKMVSEVVSRGNEFYMIVIPFVVRPDVKNIEGLLVDCEEALLERQVREGLDCEGRRPKAHVVGTEVDGISCEVKIYPNRERDTRYVLRAVAPALVELLQERGAMARVMEPPAA